MDTVQLLLFEYHIEIPIAIGETYDIFSKNIYMYIPNRIDMKTI